MPWLPGKLCSGQALGPAGPRRPEGPNRSGPWGRRSHTRSWAPAPCLPTSALALLLVLCSKWALSFSWGKNTVADGHQGPGWDTVQIQVRPQHAHQLSGCPLPGQKSPQQGSGVGATGVEGGSRTTLLQGQSCSVWYPCLTRGPLSIRGQLLRQPTLLSQEALRVRSHPYSHQGHGGGEGREGPAGGPGKHKTWAISGTRVFFLLGRPLNGESREGQGIKAALGTTSPRLLSWSLGPLLMPFRGVSPVEGGRGYTPSKGASEASFP